MRDGDEILGLPKVKATTRTIMAEPGGTGGRAGAGAGAGQAKQTLAQTDRTRRAGGQAGRMGVGNKSARVGYAAYQEMRRFSWHFDLLILAPLWVGVAANILLLLCKYSTVGVGHAEAGEGRVGNGLANRCD